MREPLVFIPGMMCDARLFQAQNIEISRQRPVMVSPITSGARIEEITSNILPHLPPRFALAGWSMGGIVAMDILRRIPDRVTRIALMDTTPLAETPSDAAAFEPRIIGAMAGRLEHVIDEFMQSDFLAPGPHRTSVFSLMRDMGLKLGPEVFVNQARALQRRGDQQKTLRKCRVPALVLCGEHDLITPVKRHIFMAGLISDATLKIVRGAGHLPSLEKPDDTTAALLDWLSAEGSAQPLGPDHDYRWANQ